MKIINRILPNCPWVCQEVFIFQRLNIFSHFRVCKFRKNFKDLLPFAVYDDSDNFFLDDNWVVVAVAVVVEVAANRVLRQQTESTHEGDSVKSTVFCRHFSTSAMLSTTVFCRSRQLTQKLHSSTSNSETIFVFVFLSVSFRFKLSKSHFAMRSLINFEREKTQLFFGSPSSHERRGSNVQVRIEMVQFVFCLSNA